MARKVIKVSLNPQSIDAAISELEAYKASLTQKAREITQRLASYGATSASLYFARSIYTGPNDAQITVEQTDRGYLIRASGESVLFIEFGAGISYLNVDNPLAGEFGMGPGTYPIPPGKGHWDDPNGWYLPKDAQAADGTNHTYGNPPNMPMYNTAQDLRREVESIVREVFARD